MRVADSFCTLDDLSIVGINNNSGEEASIQFHICTNHKRGGLCWCPSLCKFASQKHCMRLSSCRSTEVAYKFFWAFELPLDNLPNGVTYVINVD